MSDTAIFNMTHYFFETIDNMLILKDKSLSKFFMSIGFVEVYKKFIIVDSKKTVDISFKLKDNISEIVNVNSQTYLNYCDVFRRTFTSPETGINSIFAHMLNKIGTNNLNRSITFDPIRNRSGENKGTSVVVKYKNVTICTYTAGNGSMYNAKNHGHTFLLNAGLWTDSNCEPKFSVVHKMDGRYVAIYIFSIDTDEGKLSFFTVHSRGGMVLGNAVYLNGSLKEIENVIIEWSVVQKRSHIDDNGKKKWIDHIFTNDTSLVTNDNFSPEIMKRTINEQEVTIPLISELEYKSAFSIASKLHHLVPSNCVLLVNCEGTKDNMRPLYDKYIAATNQTGLFVHPIGSVIYKIIDKIIDVNTIMFYIDEMQYLQLDIPCCTLILSPQNEKFWNISDIIRGLDQSKVEFGNIQQNVFNLVTYVNNFMFNKMNDGLENVKFNWNTLTTQFPDHITEGCVIGIRYNNTIRYIKVKDEQFADDEEKMMVLEKL